jgi:hypothetical protein
VGFVKRVEKPSLGVLQVDLDPSERIAANRAVSAWPPNELVRDALTVVRSSSTNRELSHANSVIHVVHSQPRSRSAGSNIASVGASSQAGRRVTVVASAMTVEVEPARSAVSASSRRTTKASSNAPADVLAVLSYGVVMATSLATPILGVAHVRFLGATAVTVATSSLVGVVKPHARHV